MLERPVTLVLPGPATTAVQIMPEGQPSTQDYELRQKLLAMADRVTDLEAKLEDAQQVIRQLKRIVRPEDLAQCQGRRYGDSERCQRVAELGQAYCKLHLAGKARGAARLAKSRMKREKAGWW